MIWFLRLLFSAIIGAMLWVTTWASLTEALGDFAAGPVIRNPWVVATLFDAYFAFISVYVWIAWKEQSLGSSRSSSSALSRSAPTS
jgi:membrane protein DedA with SNARE-associated domain